MQADNCKGPCSRVHRGCPESVSYTTRQLNTRHNKSRPASHITQSVRHQQLSDAGPRPCNTRVAHALKGSRCVMQTAPCPPEGMAHVVMVLLRPSTDNRDHDTTAWYDTTYTTKRAGSCRQADGGPHQPCRHTRSNRASLRPPSFPRQCCRADPNCMYGGKLVPGLEHSCLCLQARPAPPHKQGWRMASNICPHPPSPCTCARQHNTTAPVRQPHSRVSACQAGVWALRTHTHVAIANKLCYPSCHPLLSSHQARSAESKSPPLISKARTQGASLS